MTDNRIEYLEKIISRRNIEIHCLREKIKQLDNKLTRTEKALKEATWDTDPANPKNFTPKNQRYNKVMNIQYIIRYE